MTRYITLAEYLWLAEQVTGIGVALLVKLSRLELADSALRAPAAGFGEHEFFPDPSTRRRYWCAIWPAIIPCPTGTSGLRG